MGRDSIIGTPYSNSLYARRSRVQIPVGLRLSAHIQTSPVAHRASYRRGSGSFPGVMRMGHGIDYPPPPSTEVKERIQLYIYSPSGLSWLILGWSLPLPSHILTPYNLLVLLNITLNSWVRSSIWFFHSGFHNNTAFLFFSHVSSISSFLLWSP
jgi:hypothetical protein